MPMVAAAVVGMVFMEVDMVMEEELGVEMEDLEVEVSEFIWV